jgi:hypothetical protein
VDISSDRTRHDKLQTSPIDLAIVLAILCQEIGAAFSKAARRQGVAWQLRGNGATARQRAGKPAVSQSLRYVLFLNGNLAVFAKYGPISLAVSKPHSAHGGRFDR